MIMKSMQGSFRTEMRHFSKVVLREDIFDGPDTMERLKEEQGKLLVGHV